MNERILFVMVNRKLLEKTVIKVLKGLSNLDKISSESKIEDLSFDSITWIQFFNRLEEKNIEVDDFASIFIESANLTFIYELIDLLDNHIS